MRSLYTVLFTLLLPLVLLRLYWRGVKAPAYRERWLERLAVYDKSYPENVMWFHAVSVGEAEAVFPLVRLMQQRLPELDILITTTTPTGSSRVQAVLGDSVEHVYLPYDIPLIVSRFLKTFKPRMAVIMEKEIWPNLFAQCAEAGIPLYIINARLSAGSARNYKKIPSLMIPAFNAVTAIATQTLEDRARFVEIGAPAKKVRTEGNIKFDVTIGEDLIEQGHQLKRQVFPERYVWIVASTHQGEDEIFLDSYKQLKDKIPELLLMIVPRHPERFQTVKRLSEGRNLNAVMRSGDEFCTTETDVYIADTMGELKMLFAAADIAFVGGSMTSVGGHNILEPLAVGLPTLFGPHMFNFKEIAENVLAMQAAVQCKDKDEIIAAVERLYNDAQYAKTLADNGQVFLRNNQGATENIFALLTQT